MPPGYQRCTCLNLLLASVFPAALRALLADVDAHRLLQQLDGGSVPAGLQRQYAQLFTARMLGAAVTPASVAAIRAASVEQDIVPQLQQLTAELSYLLHVHSGEQPSDRLVEKVREHCRLMQLLQAAAQDKMWRLVSVQLLAGTAWCCACTQRLCDSLLITPSAVSRASLSGVEQALSLQHSNVFAGRCLIPHTPTHSPMHTTAHAARALGSDSACCCCCCCCCAVLCCGYDTCCCCCQASMNLETLQEEAPLVAHWESVSSTDTCENVHVCRTFCC
jgi:hypothetical protein